MTDALATKPRLTKNDVIEQLLGSASVVDQCKGNQLRALVRLSREQWYGYFGVIDFVGAAQRRMAAICHLRVEGLVWVDGRTVPYHNWTFALDLPHRYPLTMPRVRFVKAIPFCPHVVHGEFLPQLHELPAELQEYLRCGEGDCCYLDGGQWMADPAMRNLAVVCWQVSRVISFNKIHGEAGSLNQVARDYALNQAEQGVGPLGPALPLPDLENQGNERDREAADDIEWIDDDEEGERDAANDIDSAD